MSFLVLVQPKSPLQFTVAQNEKQVNAICETFASKPASLVYFLLNGQLIKQPLYKYLQLGDLITSRNNDPLVSSTLSLRIPLNNLPIINQIVNSIEYHQFKIDLTNYDRSYLDSIKTLTIKTDLLNEFTQLTNQQINDHQINDGISRFKHNRMRRNSFKKFKQNQLDMNKQIDKEIDQKMLNKLNPLNHQPIDQQTRHRRMAVNDIRDQLLKNSLTNSKMNETNNLELNKSDETKLTKTINQVNGLISSIQNNLDDSNLRPFKNSVNLSFAFLNHMQTVDPTLNILNKVNSITHQFQWPIFKTFFYPLKQTTDLNDIQVLKNKTVDKTTISTNIDLLDSNNPLHKSSISHHLPKPEALIFDNEDKFNEIEREGLELSCVATIAQPIATTYDEMSLEENSYLEYKPEQVHDQQNDQPIVVQDEFSVPRISTNQEFLISPGQSFQANCTVNLFQHWSFYRLQPILKWYINDREVCSFLNLFD